MLKRVLGAIGYVRAMASRVRSGRLPGRVVFGGDTSAARATRRTWPLFEQIFGWLPARLGEPKKAQPRSERPGRHNKPKLLLVGSRGPARRIRKLDPACVAEAILREKARGEDGAA